MCTLFSNLADLYIKTDIPKYRFIPRGSVSYGEVYHGCDVPDKASLAFADEPVRRNSLLIGKPMVKAYQNERKAAPFGVYVDECASCSLRGEKNSFYPTWKWHKDALAQNVSVTELAKELLIAFNGLAEMAQTDEEARRHKVHYRDVKRYFEIDDSAHYSNPYSDVNSTDAKSDEGQTS